MVDFAIPEPSLSDLLAIEIAQEDIDEDDESFHEARLLFIERDIERASLHNLLSLLTTRSVEEIEARRQLFGIAYRLWVFREQPDSVFSKTIGATADSLCDDAEDDWPDDKDQETADDPWGEEMDEAEQPETVTFDESIDTPVWDETDLKKFFIGQMSRVVRRKNRQWCGERKQKQRKRR